MVPPRSILAALPVLMAVGAAGTRLAARSGPGEALECRPWNASGRARSAWCDGRIDEYITYHKIPDGEGLCLDGQCYAEGSLKDWLQESETLPHNRAAFHLPDLDVLMGRAIERHTVDGFVLCTRFGSEGRFLTGSVTGAVQLWSVGVDNALVHFEGHSSPVHSVRFSPDGTRVLSASKDATARLWDASTGHELMRFMGHTGAVAAAIFGSNGRTVLTVSLDGTARLWSSRSGRELKSVQVSGLRLVPFIPRGSNPLVASVTHDLIRVWDVESGLERTSFQASGHLESVTFSEDGARGLAISDEHILTVWEVMTGRRLMQVQEAEAIIFTGAFSPDGRRVLTGGTDCAATLRDVETGGVLQSFASTYQHFVVSVDFSPDGSSILLAADRTAHVFNVTA